MARVGLKSEPVALSAQTVDKLIERGSGDAALLYLYLLRDGGEYDARSAAQALGWDAVRVAAAFAHLCELELAEDKTPPARKNAPKPENCPNYTRDDIIAEQENQPDFTVLLDEAELLLGRKFSPHEMHVLLELYDYVGLPTEVLLLLINWQISETEEKYGSGRRPNLNTIRRAAYEWKNNGIDTLESADAWLKRREYLKSREGELLAAVGVKGRRAVEAEQKYLQQWMEWGFPPESVRLAYERTLVGIGVMKWPYCHSILQRWHEKNAHSLEEIEAADPSKAPAKNPTKQVNPKVNGGRTDADASADARKNAAWMRKILAEDENA